MEIVKTCQEKQPNADVLVMVSVDLRHPVVFRILMGIKNVTKIVSVYIFVGLYFSSLSVMMIDVLFY